MTPKTETDAALVSRSRADPAHFNGLFNRHAVAVHRFLSRRGGTQLADDVLGEVFTQAFAARDRYDTDRESALPWLYGIAHNLLRTELRSKERERSVTARWAARVGTDAPLEDLVARLDAERQPVLAAVATLSADEREVLLLVAWEDLTPSQAAAVLGIPAGTARSRLHRARALLRDALNSGATDTTYRKEMHA
ncbi:MAG: RNA polymerase sigma factor [Mycobacteriales bacterium]